MAGYDIDALVRDPDFQGRSFAERKAILREADAEGFGTLPEAAQSRMLVDMKGQEWWTGGKKAQRVTGNMNPTPEETRKFQKEALQNEGTIGTRIRNTSPMGMVKNAALEVPRLAEEIVTTPLSLAKKSAYGLGALATSGASLAKGNTIDESLRAGSEVMDGYEPIEGPLAPSMTGTLIGAGIEKGINVVENATGNTGFAGAGIQAAADITGLVGGGAILGKAGKAGKATLRDLSNTTRLGGMEAEVLGLADLRPGAKPKVDKVDTIINKGVDKGIRPGVAGNRTFKQSEGYHRKAQHAVKTIVENKDALKLTDEFGEPVQGLPKNLRQFSQSIDQTKSNIFRQYDEMAKTAGESGAKVDLGGIPAELLKVANNKSLQLAAPDAAAYAQKRAQSFQNVNAATDGVTTTRNNFLAAEQAQEVIAMFNQSLESFYKNPSYDTASKAYIDSLIVNNLRKELDSVIEKSAGPGYQQLKNAYGSLKAIEKDVAQRAIVDARRNVKGLLDFSDVFSGSQVVGGLISMNPATVGTGVTAKIIANLYKIKNDPNKIIENMFREVDKRYKPTPRAEFTPPTTAAKAAEINPMEGKVNTLNLPTGPRRAFDPTLGTTVETAQQPMPANTLGLPRGDGKVLDPSTGMMISRKQPDMPVNTGNLGRETTTVPKPSAQPVKSGTKTWREFLSANMGAAMKSEGGHAGAIRKLAKEWNELKKK
jgi:hypothetical protein